MRETSSAGDSESDTVFSMEDLPSIALNHLNVVDGSLRFETPDRADKIDNLDLTIGRLRSTNVWSVSLDRLAFDYQDTLSLNLALDRAQVSKDLTTLLDGFRVDLPGLVLRSNAMYAFNSEEGRIAIDSSYVTWV